MQPRPVAGLTFDDASHVYTYEGKPVPSVTQIIKPLTSQFYRGEAAEAARMRGDAIHFACQEIDDGFEPDVPKDLEGYVQAYRQFIADCAGQYEIIASEFRVFHAGWRYAGTVDRFATLMGEPTILDIKTGAYSPTMAMQLVAYASAMVNSGSVPKTPALVVLQLREDGSYRMHEIDKDLAGHLDAFLGQLRVHRWKEKYLS